MATLEEALRIKIPQKTFEFQGFTITLKILNSRETEECWESVRFMDDTSKSFAYPKQVLARAMVAINGQEIVSTVTKEESEKMTVSDLRNRTISENVKILDNASPIIIAHFYDKFNDLKKEEEKVIEELKKKEKTVKVDISGKSPNLPV